MLHPEYSAPSSLASLGHIARHFVGEMTSIVCVEGPGELHTLSVVPVDLCCVCHEIRIDLVSTHVPMIFVIWAVAKAAVGILANTTQRNIATVETQPTVYVPVGLLSKPEFPGRERKMLGLGMKHLPATREMWA